MKMKQSVKWSAAGTIHSEEVGTLHVICVEVGGAGFGADVGTFYTSEARDRAVECLNALDGIDDPAAARAVLDDPRVAAMADMHAALHRCISALSANGAPNCEAVKEARAAIAKAEAKK